MDEELPINSLDRFRKQSTKFKLDYIESGDAPIGCGGAVLRWRNPAASRSFRLVQFLTESAMETIDGKIIDRQLIDLSPGKHVYGAQIWPSEKDQPLVMFVLRGSHGDSGIQPTKIVEAPVYLRSGDLDGWTWSLFDSASKNWRQIDFDASSWQPVVRHDETSYGKRDRFRDYLFNYCRQLGAIPVGPRSPWKSDAAYCIRFEFEIPAPQMIPDEE